MIRATWHFGFKVAAAALLALALVGPMAAAGEPPTDYEVVAASQFREHMGLTSGYAFTKATFADPVGYPDRTWGTPLSKGQAEDLRGRTLRRASWQPAVDYALGQKDFAGLYFDQKDHGAPRFMFVDSIEERRDDIAILAPQGADYVVRKEAHTLAELRNVADAILVDTATLRAQGIPIVAIAPDQRTNSVVVKLSDHADSARARLEGYAAPVSIEVIGGISADTCSSRKQCPNPIKGGLRIERINYPAVFCATGPWGRINGTLYVLTAGHCLKSWGDPLVERKWMHPVDPSQVEMGTSKGSTFWAHGDCGSGTCAKVDIGWIRPDENDRDGPYNQVVEDDVGSIIQIDYRAPDSQQQEGDTVCRSALHPPRWHCDVISNIYGYAKPVDGGWVKNLVEVPFDAYCGDSGAPMVQIRFADPLTIEQGIAGTHSDSSTNGPPGGCGESICGNNCYSWYNTADNIIAHSSVDKVCSDSDC